MRPFLAIVFISVLFACETPGFDETTARQQILELEQLQRHVHFAADATTFAELLAEPNLSVNRGRVSTSTRAENQERFQGYFDSVHFIEWDDLAEPNICFSKDGTLAYSVLQKRVTVQYPTEEGLYHGSTDFAWTSIYRRTGDSWEIEAVTSTNQESSSSYLQNVVAVADCHGPDGAYTTTLAADHIGFLEFQQEYSYRKGIFIAQVYADSLGQSLRSLDQVDQALPPEVIAMLQGHNFIWMYLQPEQFFSNLKNQSPRYSEGVDMLGNPVELKRDEAQYQIQEIHMRNPMDTTELIEIQYLSFEATAFGSLPSQLRVVQGRRDTFHFEFEELLFNVEDFPSWAQ
ncbi:MAG: hypothetical protein AAFO03_12055 [Bacteroidota bacterium]